MGKKNTREIKAQRRGAQGGENIRRKKIRTQWLEKKNWINMYGKKRGIKKDG